MSMLDDIEHQKKQVLVTGYIITFAMIAGLVMFSAIAFVQGSDKEGDDPLIAYLAAGFSAVAIVLHAVVPQVVVGSQRQAWLNPPAGQAPLDASQAPAKLCGLFQTKRIMQLAFPEGAGFFCLVAYIMSGQWWLYGIVFVLVALMIFTLPTRAQLDHWIDNQMQLLELSQ